MVTTTLIVDDSEDTRWVLTQLVEYAGGTVVGQVSSAEEALSWLRGQSVDLVVTDYQMPGLMGDELARQIRRQWPRIRVALISVVSDGDLSERAKSAGVEWVLSKPVTVAVMQNVLQSAIVHGSRAPRFEKGLMDG